MQLTTFIDDNPGTNTQGTILTAAWLNNMEAEIVNAISLFLTPGSANNQLAALLQSYFAPWMLEVATVARASSSTFTVVGDRTAIYVVDRAIELTQTSSVKGYVASNSTYSGGTGLTTVPVTVTVDSGLTAVYYGQEPLNAPAPNIPVGMVAAFPVSNAPSGWLECDGSSKLQATYPALYDFLKDGGSTGIYGEADGTHFYLPDMRGRFARGWDHGAGLDPDAATRTNRGDTIDGDHVGTKQVDDFKQHVGHSVINSPGGAYQIGTPGAFDFDPLPVTGGNETRPVNINVMYCIKY